MPIVFDFHYSRQLAINEILFTQNRSKTLEISKRTPNPYRRIRTVAHAGSGVLQEVSVCRGAFSV